MFGLFIFLWNNFVDNDTSNPDIIVLAQNSIQLQFVECFSEASIGTGIKAKKSVRKLSGVNETSLPKCHLKRLT